MAKFIVYTYQFGPIVPEEQMLPFEPETPIDADALMARKGEIFEQIFADFKRVRIFEGKESEPKMLPIEGVNNKQFILFHLGDPKQIALEEISEEGKFVHSSAPSAPHCLIIIDNRKDVQRIYIEKKRAAFNANTDSIAKILERSFNCQLRKEHLYMKINHEYSSTAFWKFIRSRPHGIKSIIFKIPYPNLPRVSDNVEELLKKLNKSANSDATLKLEAAKKSILSGVTPDNPYINGLVEASAQSGAVISVKGAGDGGYTQCGKKEHKKMDLPERISNLSQEDFRGGLFNNTSDALASLLPKS